MTRRKNVTFATVPMWAIDPDTRDRHTIAAAFKLAGIEGQSVRLTAETQRALFGFVMFGKREIRVTADGISGSRSACFGTDFSSLSLSWEDVEHYIGKQTQPIW